MDQYIGVKLIDATPEIKDGSAGFFVRYDNGYESWSPTEPFERSYQHTQAMSFGVAFEAMRLGHRVRRPSWDVSSFVFIDFKEERLPQRMLLLHLFWSGTAKTYHWVPTELEALACDWQLISQP